VATLTTETTLSTLQAMLERAGFDKWDPNLQVFWDVYKDFIAMPVDGMDPSRDADMLLFQCALDLGEPAKYHPGPHYIVDFTRQFSHEDEDGEYAGMEQLGCSFYYESDPEFEAVTKPADWNAAYRPGDQFWGAPVDHAHDWIARVEASPNFKAALVHAPRAAQINQGPV
jgi:hypothetical protein